MTAPALPPAAKIMQLTNGMRLMAALRVLTRLDVAGHLADGPRTAGELAERTGAYAPALHRVLRAAAAGGVFIHRPDDRFELNAEAECLRSPNLRALFELLAADMGWRSYGALLHATMTGETAFDHVFGEPIWAHVEGDEAREQVFDQAMTHLSAFVSGSYVSGLKIAPGSRVADIGGGHGYLLAELLRANPDCTGVLFDRSPVVAGAPELLAGMGVADRVTVLGGGFPDDPPPDGCDLYLMKSVLHVLSDEDAIAALRWLHATAAARNAPVLVLDRVVAEPGAFDTAKLLDLDMLVLYGGRDRTLAEWRALLDAAGYRLDNTPEPGQWTVLECRAA